MMNSFVHVFISSGRFQSRDEMQKYIDPTYTEDGEMEPSDFMAEVGLKGYEPMCIEAIHTDRSQPLFELLKGSSCFEQWANAIPSSLVADSAICLFQPNEPTVPERSLLRYIGRFAFERKHSQWYRDTFGVN